MTPELEAVANTDELALWPDVAELAGRDPEEGRPVRPGLAKRRHRFERGETSPLEAIVVLQRHDWEGDVSSERVLGGSSLERVLGFVALDDLVTPLGLEQQRFLWAAALAAGCRVERLTSTGSAQEWTSRRRPWRAWSSNDPGHGLACLYPKSGNTWVRAMIAALDHGHVAINENMAGSAIAGARAPLERFTGLVSSELRPREGDLLRPLVDAQLDRVWSSAERVRHRKIHDALFTREGAPIVPPEATRAAIYLVRDPRDVAVSFAHHMGRDIESVVEYMAKPKAWMASYGRRATTQFRQYLGTWSAHVESWLDHDSFPWYSCATRTSWPTPWSSSPAWPKRWGGRPRTRSWRPPSRPRLSTSSRARSAKSGFKEAPARVRDRPFFRRGLAGAWRDELAPELAARIESDHAHVMKRLGYLS